MGSPLGPVLANIIVTELGKIILKDLVDKHLYVDDTLLLVKEKDNKLMHEYIRISNLQ